MKFKGMFSLWSFLLAGSVFAQVSVLQPDLIPCSPELLKSYKSIAKSKVTVPSGITIEQREAREGDPAIWSLSYMVKIEVPYGPSKVKENTSCYLLDKSKISKVRSVSYNPLKGRLIKLKLQVATSDLDGNIGAKTVEKNVRVNQLTGAVTLE